MSDYNPFIDPENKLYGMKPVSIEQLGMFFEALLLDSEFTPAKEENNDQ